MKRIKNTFTPNNNYEIVGAAFASNKITGGYLVTTEFEYKPGKNVIFSLLPVDKDRIVNDRDGNPRDKYAKMSKAELAEARAKLPEFRVSMLKEVAAALGDESPELTAEVKLADLENVATN